MIIQIINLTLFGFAVGIFGTYIGVGGGFLHVPTLLYFYGATPQQAVGTSLIVVFFNAFSGSISYAKQKRIDYKTGWKFAAATIPGAFLGVYITDYFNNKIFGMVFGIFLITVAVLTFVRPLMDSMRRKKMGSATTDINKKAGFRKTVRSITDISGHTYTYSYNFFLGLILSVFIGFISSCLGVGGGILHVPALIHLFSFPVHIATATSHFILAISAFCGATLHFAKGNVMVIPGIFMSVGTIIGAQIGATIARKSKPIWITLALSGMMLIVGIQMSKIHFNNISNKNIHNPGNVKNSLNNIQNIPSISNTVGANAISPAVGVHPNAVTKASPHIPAHAGAVRNLPDNKSLTRPDAVTKASPGVPPTRGGASCTVAGYY